MSEPPKEEADLLDLARRYGGHVRRSNRGHYTAAEHLSRWHQVLGIVTAVCAGVVGTSIFATIDGSPSPGWQIGAGLVTLASAVLATLQTTLNLDKRAAEHRSAGAAYGKLRRRFELLIALGPDPDGAPPRLRPALEELTAEMDVLASSVPLVPPRADRKVMKTLSTSP